jgi:hypothetical protein
VDQFFLRPVAATLLASVDNWEDVNATFLAITTTSGGRNACDRYDCL